MIDSQALFMVYGWATAHEARLFEKFCVSFGEPEVIVINDFSK
jgi:hypothetical protein